MTDIKTIRTIKRDVAITDGEVVIMATKKGSDGPPTAVRKFLVSAVLVDTPAGWKIRWLRAFPQPVSAAPPSQ